MTWVSITSDTAKYVLAYALRDDRGNFAPKLNASFPVDVHLCESCGVIQMFAVPGQPDSIQ